VAEEFGLLLEEQMGFRASRSIESALDLLTSQIQIIRENKDYIAIVLLFDILGAFDSIVPKRLREVAKEFGLLLKEQMGFRASRSIESTLDLLTS